MNQVSSFFSNLLSKQLKCLQCYMVLYWKNSLPDLVMFSVCKPFNFLMICSISSFTYGRLIISSLGAIIESNSQLTLHKAWDALHYMTPHWFIERDSIYWNSFRVEARSKDECAIGTMAQSKIYFSFQREIWQHGSHEKC